jgi:Domain of unknown function (DUF1906)
MNLIARSATPGNWVDTDVKCNDAALESLVNAGIAGVYRYLPLPRNGLGSDLASPELDLICSMGLELGAVQHVRMPGWNPADHSGHEDAVVATAYAALAGLAKGTHIFLDLEGLSSRATSIATKGFAEDWAHTVLGAGYLAGLYVGYDLPLDAEALYLLHGITSYWSDAGNRAVLTRGFSLKQHAGDVTLGGVAFDRDTLQADRLGDVPRICAMSMETMNAA